MAGKPIEELIGGELRQQGWKLATAESLTGGLIGHRMTNVPGSSKYYAGGLIVYSNSAKEQLLGVKHETLERDGAVSQETALEMAAGARRALQSEAGLAVTGIAGPGGAEPGKPVGLVWIAVSLPHTQQAWQFNFSGSREQVKEKTAETALNLLYLQLLAVRLEAVQVQTRTDRQGRLVPVEFRWHGAVEQVESTGRRETDGAGEHILCRTVDGSTFTLLYSASLDRWFVEKAAPAPKAV